VYVLAVAFQAVGGVACWHPMRTLIQQSLKSAIGCKADMPQAGSYGQCPDLDIGPSYFLLNSR
jgi:hypothetical protein